MYVHVHKHKGLPEPEGPPGPEGPPYARVPPTAPRLLADGLYVESRQLLGGPEGPPVRVQLQTPLPAA
jgi:hypothetical protein